jgi:hypothetical protein
VTPDLLGLQRAIDLLQGVEAGSRTR